MPEQKAPAKDFSLTIAGRTINLPQEELIASQVTQDYSKIEKLFEEQLGVQQLKNLAKLESLEEYSRCLPKAVALGAAPKILLAAGICWVVGKLLGLGRKD